MMENFMLDWNVDLFFVRYVFDYLVRSNALCPASSSPDHSGGRSCKQVGEK